MEDWKELNQLIKELDQVKGQAQPNELEILVHQIFGLIDKIDLTLAQQLAQPHTVS